MIEQLCENKQVLALGSDNGDGCRRREEEEEGKRI